MSMSTNYRYEVITEKQGMRLALERQKDIINVRYYVLSPFNKILDEFEFI